MSESKYNPDVLSCLANLSNDEVFTPPNVVNSMLDMLPQELFENKATTFLDIGTKSGVFLREIAKRLIKGLESEIPDLQMRVDHILHKQLFGIATTELTSLVSRRTLYCSKYPNCRYSASLFDTVEGNIRFRAKKHDFVNGRCKWCGASAAQFDRDDGLESHAYEFIHTDKPEEIFNMKFDVIVGNPPYQMGTAGEENGAQAKPIYDKFVEHAKKMLPRFVVMIIPSRWFTGGWGLDEFRDAMISDNHMMSLHDFPNSNDCFPGVLIKGGVCYFLWSRDYNGECCVVTHRDNGISKAKRYLKESNTGVFVRWNEAVEISRKVSDKKEPSLMSIVSSQKPFGLGTSFHGSKSLVKDGISIYERGGVGYVSRHQIPKLRENIDMYKVYISAAYGAGEGFPHQILNVPIFGDKGSCCTETYIMIGAFKKANEAKNLETYIRTRFFRFMVMILKNSQHALKKVYQLVPMQDFSKPWVDEELYKKYNLTVDEIKFIESMIKPME